MKTVKPLKYLTLSSVLLLPLLAFSMELKPAGGGIGFVCGTSRARQRDAIERAKYHESRIQRLRHPLASSSAEPVIVYQAVQQDIGDVAVIEDDGTLIAEPNPLDLNGRSFRFEPGDSSSYRLVSSGAVLDVSGGTEIKLRDDDSVAVPLQFPFTFYGKSYSSVQVNSDGNLTFLQADNASTDRDLGRFASGPPRIGPLFTDLNPEQGGKISFRNDGDGVLFVWNGVPEWADGTPAVFDSFSVKLFQNGNIEFVYGTRLDSRNAVVGISPGSSLDGITSVSYDSSGLPTGGLTGTIVEVFASKIQLSESSVAKRFFQSHPDAFDHLTLFLGFPYDLGGNAYAYELNVKNEIQGIGLEVFDDSTFYGSSHRLRSFLNMGTLTGFVNGLGRYPDDPNQVFFGTNSTMGIMGQESGHRWEAFTRFRDGATNASSILGRDLAHWSFFFNSEGSVMEGNGIQDRGADKGNTRFLTTNATDGYSKLDQYIMGLLPKDLVPPMFLVESPFGTLRRPADAPAVNVTFGGNRKDVSIDDIVAANGTRVPSASQAPKVFRQGFIYLTRKGQVADPAQIAKVQRIRDAWVKFFNERTERRGWIVTDLQASAATTSARFFVPFFQGSKIRYTGVAVANWGATPADVLFTAYDNAGNPLAAPAGVINPRMLTISPGSQIAMLAEQIHGLTLGDPRNGWIQIQSSSSQLSGFFLDGDIAQTMLTGAVIGSQTSTSLIFLRAQVSSATSQGNSFKNLIVVANPNSAAAQATLTLMDETGNPIASASRTIPPRGRLSEDLPALFPGFSQPREKGYIALASNSGVVGYQEIDTGATVFSLPAIENRNATQLYSAQFASGPAGNIRYFSELNLINTGNAPRNIRALLVGNDGSPVSGINNPASLPVLGPGGQYRARGESIFGLDSANAATKLVEGSLVITSDGPGVIGDIAFGDPVQGRFIASLPLDPNPAGNLVLSQVAEGGNAGEKPYFTGIAIYNPGTNNLNVSIEVYSEQGNKTGTATIPLAAGNRISKTLPQLIPGLQAQRGGYIRLSANGGSLVAYELFGTQTLDFLAAVPPQVITP